MITEQHKTKGFRVLQSTIKFYIMGEVIKMEYGIDISNHNSTINYDEARRFGKIAYIKIGEGHSWIDPDCDKIYNNCKSRGLDMAR